MLLIFDAMHDEQWTRMAVMGWVSQLGKFALRIGKRAKRGRQSGGAKLAAITSPG
jgi:hypothetical protein